MFDNSNGPNYTCLSLTLAVGGYGGGGHGVGPGGLVPGGVGHGGLGIGGLGAGMKIKINNNNNKKNTFTDTLCVIRAFFSTVTTVACA